MRILFRRPSSPSVPTQITWTLQEDLANMPALMYYTSGEFCHVSRKILWWVNPEGSSDIYGTAIHAYAAALSAALRWQMIGGSVGLANSCSSHLSASPLPWPGNRHVCQHWMIDRARNIGVLLNGVCANNERNDEWHYDLNADPADNTWTGIEAEGALTLPTYGMLVHDTIRDLWISTGMYGNANGEVWVKAPTASVNASQIACGAATAGVWYRAVAAGDTPHPLENQYNDGAFSWMHFDPIIGKVRYFANRSQTAGGRQHWLYSPSAKAWVDDTANVIDIPTYNTPRSTGYKDTVPIASGPFSGRGLYLHHKESRSSDCSGATQSYLFDSSTNAYTALTTIGGGPSCSPHMVWDEENHLVVALSAEPGNTGLLNVWHGEVAA